MKILILGAKGNLGEQLVKTFSDGNDIIAWDREEIDVTDKALITNKIKSLKPGLIINATAYNAVDLCETEAGKELAEKLNAQAPAHLAQAAMEVGAILVHYSTDYVFEGKKRAGYAEADQPKPINNYGLTKRSGEEEIIRLSGRGLKWYLIRTSKLFGPRGTSDVSKPSFFDVMLKLAAEKPQLEVVDEEKSCFTYTPDLALATKKLITDNSGYGIYHIVNPGPVTWFGAVKELFKLKDVKTPIIAVKGDKFPRPAKRPKYSVLLNTKTDQLRDWREALKEYLIKQ